VIIDWPTSFGDHLDQLEARAGEGDEYAQLRLDRLYAELQVLQELTVQPQQDTAVLKRVRQSGRHPVWRVAHPFHPRVAGAPHRVVSPEERDRVVVALFAGEKASMGDVFYNSVASRADATIAQWQFQHRTDKDTP